MKICIVTNKHISYNPRVVKEADAFAESGHSVSVVAVCNSDSLSLLDDEISKSSKWSLLTVKYRRVGVVETARWASISVRQRIYRLLSNFFLGGGIAEVAAGREFYELRELACSVAADVYIAHHVEALGAAFAASQKYNSRLFFDAEDFHSGMYTAAGEFDQNASVEEVACYLVDVSRTKKRNAEQRCLEYLEQKYLVRCAQITAASDGIGAAYSRKYRIDRPVTILNSFPLEDVKTDGGFYRGASKKIRLYWYSQVIGPGRGLEFAIRALARVVEPCELHLRGSSDGAFILSLMRLAGDLGVEERVFFHPPCSPGNLIKYASEYDIGLALENDVEINRVLCLTNKILTYMNAGLAIVASNTPAQRDVIANSPGCGVMCRMNDVDSLVDAINVLIRDSSALRHARLASRLAAVSTYNWAVEKAKLISLL